MTATTSIDFSSTSLPGITGATTPSTFKPTTTGGPQYTIGAELTESDTTVTAFQVPGTTGLLVVDGTTLTWRQQGITLSDGDVISAGFNGLQDQTTTAQLGPITVATSGGSGSSSTMVTIQTTNPSASASQSLTAIHGTHTTAATTSSAAGGSAASAASSTGAAAPTCTLGAGKAVALLGALGGMMAFGF